MDKITELSANALAHPGMRQVLQQAKKWAFIGPAGYLLLVAVLRKSRLRQMQKESKYRTRKDMAKMTDYEAHKIIRKIVQLEFPFTFLIALQFALFRVSHHSRESEVRGEKWKR